MRAGAPKRVAIRGSLDYMGKDGAISVPVLVYRRQTELKNGGVEFHLYHSVCHSRVLYKLWCSGCQKEIFRHQIQKLSPIGGDKKEVSQDELEDIFNTGDKSIRISGTIDMRTIPAMMMNNTFVFHDSFMVRALKMGHQARAQMPTIEKQLRLVFDALGKNKQALYVEVPGYSMRRMGLLFPHGDLVTLKYEEEIREEMPMMYPSGKGYDKQELTDLSDFLKSKDMTLDTAPSCAGMVEKVDQLLLSKAPVGTDNDEGNIQSRIEVSKKSLGRK